MLTESSLWPDCSPTSCTFTDGNCSPNQQGELLLPSCTDHLLPSASPPDTQQWLNQHRFSPFKRLFSSFSGVWIPKEENSTQLDQFRIISLLCVEAKVFFSAVSKRLCTYLAENTYIDTSVQKGGISGMPGCLEHTGVVTQLIREARENKGNLSVLWLDLENAFGSIPHKLVQFTLTKHHVPSRCRDLIADYYSNEGLFRSNNIQLAQAMNMLTKSAEPGCRGPRTNSGQRQPPIRAFMDDLTVMTESVPGCRWILMGLEELVEWARMRFKPAKSRSMVLRKGKVVDKFRFNIADTAIPSISEKPVKSLGKVYHALYLEDLTLVDLSEKIASLYNLTPLQITAIYRQGPTGIHILVSDEMVQNLRDDTNFFISTIRDENTEGYHVVLK
ncbi:hypothetical protein NHX12_005617 [Muraenolepis orangiensis]|uniref:Reverse transcriptase domain-containing protein n=1 Tax=Muraenolepis orangiensis TaxID=630683 RepID=A0A9Q0DVD0_9TELE|nr:hypothetical protein NHX12_005617 [Muraenolepis orangiensis]